MLLASYNKVNDYIDQTCCMQIVRTIDTTCMALQRNKLQQVCSMQLHEITSLLQGKMDHFEAHKYFFSKMKNALIEQ